MMFIQRRCVLQFINGIAALNTKYIQANEHLCLDVVMRSVGIVTLFDRILGREMGKQCIAEKQNNSASGIGERVVDLITLRSHFLI